MACLPSYDMTVDLTRSAASSSQEVCNIGWHGEPSKPCQRITLAVPQDLYTNVAHLQTSLMIKSLALNLEHWFWTVYSLVHTPIPPSLPRENLKPCVHDNGRAMIMTQFHQPARCSGWLLDLGPTAGLYPSYPGLPHLPQPAGPASPTRAYRALLQPAGLSYL